MLTRKTISGINMAFAAVLFAGAAYADARVWLDELSVREMMCGWKTPRRNKTVEGGSLQIGSQKFERGVGTHAESIAIYDVAGKAVAFDADVGIDAEVFPGENGAASIRFLVKADGRTVAETGVLKGKRDPVHVHADLAGAKTVELLVSTAGDGENFDHADWANAYFTMKDGTRPVPVPLGREQLGILTPPPPASPRINGAKVFGVRPGHPIVWRLPVTGERPMTLKAENLPAGAAFDEATGILSGAVSTRGSYVITFTASNAKGTAKRTLRLEVGDKIALTPPMGWNSWNCFASAVTEKDIRGSIDAFAGSGLADHGWSYVNIDDYWQNKPSAKNDPTLQGPERNPDGSIAVNKRFKCMKALADYAHSKGLKIGLYSSPGPYTCGGRSASTPRPGPTPAADAWAAGDTSGRTRRRTPTGATTTSSTTGAATAGWPSAPDTDASCCLTVSWARPSRRRAATSCSPSASTAWATSPRGARAWAETAGAPRATSPIRGTP